MLDLNKNREEDEKVGMLIQPGYKDGKFDFCGEIHGE